MSEGPIMFNFFAVSLLKRERGSADTLDILFIYNDEVFWDATSFLSMVQCPKVSNWPFKFLYPLKSATRATLRGTGGLKMGRTKNKIRISTQSIIMVH